MLSVGIVGLPNVGKSTLFNALTTGRAEVSNYPFTTIQSNVGVVPIPDPRLSALETALRPQKTTPCAIRFIDIAGLVEGASRGEGLGNQFLGEIRQVDAIAHVVRCFETPDVAHVFAEVDPVRDADVIETELVLADLEVLGRAMAKRQKEWQTHPQDHAAERHQLEGYRSTLEQGIPLRSANPDTDDRRRMKTAGLLTGKPVLLVANVSGEREAQSLDRLCAERAHSRCVSLDADLELELASLDPGELQLLLDDLGLPGRGSDRLIRSAFDLLGLITFYTVAKDKLQAWEVPAGTPAAVAAGRIHTDMERGFIRAEVVAADELVEFGDFHEIRSRGHLKTVGRDYEVSDGDVIEFLFNV